MAYRDLCTVFGPYPMHFDGNFTKLLNFGSNQLRVFYQHMRNYPLFTINIHKYRTGFKTFDWIEGRGGVRGSTAGIYMQYFED
jgi:hypothetical protein